MTTMRANTVVEQNPITLQTINVDTAIYATAATGSVTIRKGRDYVLEYVVAGVQTASLHQVILDRFNAGAGDEVVIRRGTSANTGTSIIGVYDGSASGQLLVQLTTNATQLGGEGSAVFNGVAWQA
jgi:microcompartment protein CcmK/EutM